MDQKGSMAVESSDIRDGEGAELKCQKPSGGDLAPRLFPHQ